MHAYIYIYIYIRAQNTPTEAIAVAPGTKTVRQGSPVVIAKSPSWHRRLRKRRSAARALLRKGLNPSKRRLRDLAVHHGTAPHTSGLLSRMGRGGKSGQQPWQQGDRGYRVWPGAYSPQQYAAKDKRPWRSENTRAAPTFPSYASVTVPTDKPLATGSATDRAGGRTSSTTPAIQAALNQTRKAENRVIRLHDALAESGKLWEEYQAQMKEAFRLERLRFAKDKDKLAKAILEAEEAQEAARQNLRNVFAGSQGIAETGDVTMDGPDADQVFSEWLREEAGDDDAMIRRALAPASQTPNRGARPAQRTPTPGPGQAVMAPPGLAIAPTPPAMTDPYYNAMSPTMVPAGLYPHAYMGQAPMIPAGATGAFLQPHLAMMGATGPAAGLVPATAEGAAPPNPAPPSSGEPVAEGYGRSPTLQDRVARRKAMEPFGGSRHPPAVPDEGATTDTAGPATGPTRPGSVPIVEDDDEDELINVGGNDLS